MFKLLKSVIKSIGKAIHTDPEVEALAERHPKLFGFIKHRLSPDKRFGLHLTVGVISTLIFIFLFFSLVEDLVSQDATVMADLRIINLLQLFRTPLFTKIMLYFTYLGNWQVVLFGVLCFGALFALSKRWKYAWALLISTAGAEAFVWIVKNIIQRPRPLLVNALIKQTGYSFPSGHALVTFAFYGLLTYIAWREYRSKIIRISSLTLGIAVIAIIGFSRIYLGVHYPSDVLASYAAGAAWLSVIITALEIRRKSEHEKPMVLSHKSLIAATGFVLLKILWIIFTLYFFNAHPLAPHGVPVENQMTISEKDIPEGFFSNLSRTSEDLIGKPIEPINIIVIGSKEQLDNTFQKASWYPIDQISVRSTWLLLKESILNGPYPQAPATPSFWNAEPDPFAYEQPTSANTVRERHHIHFWNTPFIIGNQSIWFATASYDKNVKLQTSFVFVTHEIDPNVDKEREKVKDDLNNTGNVAKIEEVQIVEPTLGSNSAGSSFFTDGKAYVIFLKNSK